MSYECGSSDPHYIRISIRLKQLLRRFRGPVEVDESLLSCLKLIWKTLADDGCNNVDVWLLSARAAVCGLYYISTSNEDFYNEFETFWHKLIIAEDKICVPYLNLDVKFKCDRSFRAACALGFMHLVSARNGLFTKAQMDFMLKYVIYGCTEYSRFNKTFVHMLYDYVKCYKNEMDIDAVLKVVMYNLDHKESVMIIEELMPLRADYLFNELITNVPWLYKHKYVLLNTILKFDRRYVDLIPHKDFARALVYAQGCANLAAASSKLYIIILKNIESDMWLNTYHPIIKESIVEPINVTLAHRNIFKLIMKDTIKTFPFLFPYILSDLQAVRPFPIDGVLNLIVIGCDLNFCDSNYNEDVSSIIERGKSSLSASIRHTGLHLMIKYVKKNLTYLDQIQQCLMSNINDADKTGREYIVKCFDLLFKHIHDEVHKEGKDKEVIGKLTQFLQWMIDFLFNQLNIGSNYRRLSLTIALICNLQNIFQRYSSNDMVAGEMTPFLQCVQSYKLQSNDRIFDLLTFASEENKQQVFQLILNVIPMNQFEKKKQQIWSKGHKNILSTDLDTSLVGLRFMQMYVEYAIKTDDKYFQQKIDILYNMTHYQWHTVKNSDRVTVVAEGNTIYPLLNLLNYIHQLHANLNIRKYYGRIMSLVEDMVENLLPIFHCRAMLNVQPQLCKGVAQAFNDRSSEFHKNTVNCMWLTLKEMCSLISSIGITFNNEKYIKLSLQIHLKIVQQSYHKGAIESAGSGIGEIISAITKKPKLANIADEFLEEVLLELPKITTSNSTVRRSAEVRVVLSNICVNDKRYTKPLYHRTMRVIRRILQRQMGPNYKAETLTLILHCLEPLITDTKVEIHILDYVGELLLTLLGFFGDQRWDVKNAINLSFGALTNRLFKGMSSQSEYGHNYTTVCIEEITFHIGPELGNAFQIALAGGMGMAHPAVLNDILVPMICFYGTSFSRGDRWFKEISKDVLDKKNTVMQYLCTTTDFEKFMFAARTYTKLCCHFEVPNEIRRVKNALFNGEWPIAFAIALIKLLSDKVFHDEMYIPGSEEIKEQVLNELNLIFNQIYTSNEIVPSYMVSCLYNKDLTSMIPNKLKTYFILAPDPTSRIPRIFYREALQDYFMYENYENVYDVFEYYLSHDIHVSYQIYALTLMVLRIKKTNESTLFIFKGYDCLLSFLLKFDFAENLQLALVLCEMAELLDVSNLPDTITQKIFCIFDRIRNLTIPPYYFTAFVAMAPIEANSDFNGVLLQYIVWKSLFNCYDTIAEEEPKGIILRSIIYLTKYTAESIFCICLTMVTSMLHSASEEMYELVGIYVSKVFKCERTHPYECLNILIQKVETLLSPVQTFKFLYSLLNFKQKNDKHPTFASISIVKELITEYLMKNFNKMTSEEKQTYVSWMFTAKTKVPEPPKN